MRRVRGGEGHDGRHPAPLTRRGQCAALRGLLALRGPRRGARTHREGIRRHLRRSAAVVDAIDAQRVQCGLKPLTARSQLWSPRSRISHMPAALDFPRRHWPANFTHTGPFIRTSQHRVQRPFPWERLTGQRLVYASMGTLSNSIASTFHVIAEAFSTLDVQLVLSTGGGLAADKLVGLKGSPIVVDFAPQVELIERSALVVSHAGVNSCLEALLKGRPRCSSPWPSIRTAMPVAWSGWAWRKWCCSLISQSAHCVQRPRRCWRPQLCSVGAGAVAGDRGDEWTAAGRGAGGEGALPVTVDRSEGMRCTAEDDCIALRHIERMCSGVGTSLGPEAEGGPTCPRSVVTWGVATSSPALVPPAAGPLTAQSLSSSPSAPCSPALLCGLSSHSARRPWPR